VKIKQFSGSGSLMNDSVMSDIRKINLHNEANKSNIIEITKFGANTALNGY